MQIIWNEESWLPRVYETLIPLAFGDLLPKRYMLQKVKYWSHWKAWNEYLRDNMQIWDDIPSVARIRRRDEYVPL